MQQLYPSSVLWHNALKCYEKVGVGKIMVSEMTCKIFVGCLTLQACVYNSISVNTCYFVQPLIRSSDFQNEK